MNVHSDVLCVCLRSAHRLRAAAAAAAAALSCSALRARDPLCEAAVCLQHVVGAAVPREPVPVPGERQCVQLAAIQPLEQQHALLQQNQVRWAKLVFYKVQRHEGNMWAVHTLIVLNVFFFFCF